MFEDLEFILQLQETILMGFSLTSLGLNFSSNGTTFLPKLFNMSMRLENMHETFIK
jgi:hypothetical protein